MERYDYKREVRWALEDYLNENYTPDAILKAQDDDNFNDELYNICFNADAVTGKESGSFTCSRYEAEECLCHNSGIISYAIDDDFVEAWEIVSDPERADVGVRCYVLHEIFNEVIDRLADEIRDEREN